MAWRSSVRDARAGGVQEAREAWVLRTRTGVGDAQGFKAGLHGNFERRRRQINNTASSCQ